MSGDHNEATIVGRLGADPEIRQTQDGRPIANFSVATSESWRDKQTGEKKERTEWHRVVIFNEGLCGIAEKYMRKGDKVLIRGQMRTRKWEDKDGIDRYTTEIVLQGFDAKVLLLSNKSSGGVPPAQNEADYGPEKTVATAEEAAAASDDEIPF